MSSVSFSWLNEPPVWSAEGDGLRLRTGRETDFWRETFYGFTRDSGHAWLRPVTGDFTAEVTVHGDYETLYDQAGLMLRIDAATWIKTGIEYTDGLMHFSVVVTRGVSDWSVIPLPNAKPSDDVNVRLTRHGDAVRVQFSVAGSPWQMARLCPFSVGDAQIGMMACSPQRAGFEARFTGFSVGPAISRELHAEEE
jgi:regulation of enolase protein 1 (concanavalin A-like superfamily)